MMSKEAVRTEKAERAAERVDHCREIASSGGEARMAQLTPKERQKMAAAGGHAARDAIKKKYTPEELKRIMSERGRKGAAARWAKKNERPKPKPEAPVDELELEAALGW